MDEQPAKEIHRTRSRIVLNTGEAVFMESGYIILPALGCVHQPGSSTYCILWLHHVGMTGH